MKNFNQPGNIMPFTATAAIQSGAVVVVGNVLGVSTRALASGEAGELATVGVFTVPKVSGAVIAAGESLTYDVSAGAFDDNLATPATGDVTGAGAYAFESAGAGVETLRVKFTGVPGTVKTA